MATDYSKKTNADLIEILKSRSLPHTGKKADLVARLQQDDEKKATDAPATNSKTDTAEDVIDWDDEVPAEQASTEAGANAIAAGGKGAVANPVAVPNQQLDTDPAAAEELKVESTGAAAAVTGQSDATATEAEKKTAVVEFTQGLPASELEEELRKRKARAAKFGLVEDTETAVKEAEKQLDRAKRFGTGDTTEANTAVGVRGLDEALPNEPSRKRSRNDQGGRGGKRRDHGRNRNRNNRGGNGANNNPNRGGGEKSAQSGQKTLSEKDELAMEARKKRFATAA